MKNKDFRLMSYEEKYNLVKGLIFYYIDDEKFGKLIFSSHKGIKEYLIYQVLFLFLRYVNCAPKKPLLFAFKDLNVSEDEWKVYFKKEGKYEVLSPRIVNELIELIDDIGDDTSDIDNEVVEKYYDNHSVISSLSEKEHIESFKKNIENYKVYGFCYIENRRNYEINVNEYKNFKLFDYD